MQVCVWLDNQMALTTVKVCPNNAQTWLPVMVLCERAVLFPFLLPPFDSVFLLSSHHPLFPVCVVFVIVFTMTTSEIPHRCFLRRLQFCVLNRSQEEHLNRWKALFLPVQLLLTFLINSTLSTTRALVPKKA